MPENVALSMIGVAESLMLLEGQEAGCGRKQYAEVPKVSLAGESKLLLQGNGVWRNGRSVLVSLPSSAHSSWRQTCDVRSLHAVLAGDRKMNVVAALQDSRRAEVVAAGAACDCNDGLGSQHRQCHFVHDARALTFPGRLSLS